MMFSQPRAPGVRCAFVLPVQNSAALRLCRPEGWVQQVGRAATYEVMDDFGDARSEQIDQWQRPRVQGWQRLVKRSIDISGALVGLVLAVPLVALAAVAIKLDSPGPVFFTQVRIGENGRRFRIYKLRSMVRDAEQQLDTLVDLRALADDPAFKLPNDPRVTRVGRTLRRTSLDEVPQFYNVLRGDMSLVGPRPEEERIVQFYTDYHRRRLAVKPGMTGPIQVAARGNASFSARLKFELEYIEHYSLRRDLLILLRTIPVLLHGR